LFSYFTHEAIVVGVNAIELGEEKQIPLQHSVRARRDPAKWQAALKAVEDSAYVTGNLMPVIVEARRGQCHGRRNFRCNAPGVRRIPTSRRAAGVGLGYSSGALLGAWFSVYVWWAHRIPFIAAIEKQDMWLSPAVILTIGAVMTFVSLWFSPETKHLQLNEVGERERASGRVEDLPGLPEPIAAD
jgi:hypothetical protein